MADAKKEGGIMMNVLQVKNLSYKVPARRLLQDISITVPKGSFVGLIGPNGSGKTTLLKNVYQVLCPESGEISIEEQDIRSLTQKQIARKMAVLRQESETDFDYSVQEITTMGRFPYHGLLDPDSAEDKKIVEKNLKRVGMWDSRERMMSTLSGGEKQRVMIARALTQDTGFLVLDEPTNHLDIYYKLEILELVKSMDITVISAIHDLDLAGKYCDFLFVIAAGIIVAKGTPRQVITQDMMREVFRVNTKIGVNDATGQISIDYLGPV